MNASNNFLQNIQTSNFYTNKQRKYTILRTTFKTFCIFGYLLEAFNVPCQDWCQDQFWLQWLDPFSLQYSERNSDPA